MKLGVDGGESMIEGDSEKEEEGATTWGLDIRAPAFRDRPYRMVVRLQGEGIDIGAPEHWGWRGLKPEAGLLFLMCWQMLS